MISADTVFDVEFHAGTFPDVRHPHVQILFLSTFEKYRLVAVLHFANLKGKHNIIRLFIDTQLQAIDLLRL